jgi:hypothetical protein
LIAEIRAAVNAKSGLPGARDLKLGNGTTPLPGWRRADEYAVAGHHPLMQSGCTRF